MSIEGIDWSLSPGPMLVEKPSQFDHRGGHQHRQEFHVGNCHAGKYAKAKARQQKATVVSVLGHKLDRERRRLKSDCRRRESEKHNTKEAKRNSKRGKIETLGRERYRRHCCCYQKPRYK
ncbi:MAG TPA: hypothetical protein EYQ05_15340 [Gammaproteobacteria bacterium]|nr:hypothetical protein [Gammaproteobacteria bacterium]